MNTTSEERKEIALLGIRHLLTLFPVVGSLLNDVFFQYRSNIKQARVNKFVESLEQQIASLDIDPRTLQTEASVDLFETIFRKVADNRSEEKREGLKNILVHGLQHQGEVEYCELFADLLLSIHSKELEVLAAHEPYLLNGKGPLTRKQEIEEELDQRSRAMTKRADPVTHLFMNTIDLRTARSVDIMLADLAETKELLEQYRQMCVPERFGMSEDELKFFLQNLLSKGLLRDDGVGSIGVDPNEIMSITHFGLKFLQFIKR